MRVLVIIPSFNEETALPAVLEGLRQLPAALGASLTPLVIDDGSTDRTAQVASACGARVLRLCTNLGIGGAVQTGLRVAHEEGFDAALQLDGDGQHPASEIARLLAALAATPAPDLVVGSRYLAGEGFQSTPMRRVGKSWLSVVLRLCAGVRSTDPTSGFRVFGPRAIALFQRSFPYDYPEPESLSLAQLHGLRLAEVPVTMRERQGGQSSIRGLLGGWYMLKATAAIVLDLVRTQREFTEEERWKKPSADIGSSPSSASASPSPSSASSRGSA